MEQSSAEPRQTAREKLSQSLAGRLFLIRRKEHPRRRLTTIVRDAKQTIRKYKQRIKKRKQRTNTHTRSLTQAATLIQKKRKRDQMNTQKRG